MVFIYNHIWIYRISNGMASRTPFGKITLSIVGNCQFKESLHQRNFIEVLSNQILNHNTSW